MRTWKCTMVEMIRNKKSWYLAGIFVLIALMFCFRARQDENGFIVGMSYMLFAGTILATQSTVKTREEEGFLLLLPATMGQRVRGKFLSGFLTMAVCSVSYTALAVIGSRVTGIGIEGVLTEMLGSAAAAWVCVAAVLLGTLVNDIQFLAGYLVNESSRSSTVTIVRVMIPMSFYFGVMFLTGWMERLPPESRAYENVNRGLLWFGGHRMAVWAVSVGFVLLFTTACIGISAAVCRRKDFT